MRLIHWDGVEFIYATRSRYEKALARVGQEWADNRARRTMRLRIALWAQIAAIAMLFAIALMGFYVASVTP